MRHVPGFDQGWRGYNDRKYECPLTPALSRSGGEGENGRRDSCSVLKNF